jgi:hypothetical protein
MRGYLFADAVKVSPHFVWGKVQTVFAGQSRAILLRKIVQPLPKIYLRYLLQQGLLLRWI